MHELPPSEVAFRWLQRARSDLLLGQAALQAQGVLPEDACFHAQQCAEKALKGLLTYLGVPFPRTHALEVLLDLLEAHGINLPEQVNEAFGLSQYAVETRYPGEWEPVTPQEARSALNQAMRVLVWAEKQIAGERGVPSRVPK